jgi:hypothetical protein
LSEFVSSEYLVSGVSSGGNPELQLSSQNHGKSSETSNDKAKVSQEEAHETVSAADPQPVKHEGVKKIRNDKTPPVSYKLTEGHEPISAADPQIVKHEDGKKVNNDKKPPVSYKLTEGHEPISAADPQIVKHEDGKKVNNDKKPSVSHKFTEAHEPASAADPQIVKHEDGKKVNNDKKPPISHKLTDHNSVHNHSETKAGSAKSNSAVDVQAHVTEQIHAKSSNSVSNTVTGISTTIGKHEGNLEKATNLEEITVAPISENKATAGVEIPHKEVQNKNVVNGEPVMHTEKKYNKSQNTDIESNVPNDDDHEQSENSANLDMCKCCTYYLY